MAAIDGNTASILKEQLEQLEPILEAAHRHRFFPFMALLERLTKGAVRVGGDGPPSLEVVRFRHHPDLAFNAGDIEASWIRSIPKDPENPEGQTRQVIEIITTFLGLTGAISPMPLYIADEVNQEEEPRTRRDFLDIFHHRLVSILYRAVLRYTPVAEHLSERRDRWMDRTLSISGMDPETYVEGSGIPPGRLLRIAPLIMRRGRGARALRMALHTTLSDLLNTEADVQIIESAGGWTPIDPEQRSLLGLRNHALGCEALLGERAFDRTGSFVVSLGPLDARARDSFVEGGEGLKRLRSCVKLVLNEPLGYDLVLKLLPDATMPFRLLTKARAFRLGKDTRLGTNPEGESLTLRDVGRY